MTEQFVADNSEEAEELTFSPRRESEREDSTVSPAENNQDGKDPSPHGDKENNEEDSEKKPFNEHPRWKEREEEWTRRFNEQEQRNQEELKKALDGIRGEFSDKKEEITSSKIPAWFGGSQEQWDAYRADRDQELKAIRDEAEKNAIAKFEGKVNSEDKAVKEATDYMNQEVKVLSEDKTLNPDGLKIDPNTLVKFTVENELVDTKGRWNYRAAFKLMKASGIIKPKTAPVLSAERKVLADASIKDSSKGDPTPKAYKTSTDFKKAGSRPW